MYNGYFLTEDHTYKRHYLERNRVYVGSLWHDNDKMFPSFLELFTYAEFVTSGPGRILPFIGSLSLSRSTIESEGNSISLFLCHWPSLNFRH